MRIGSVLMPRSNNQQSKGLGAERHAVSILASDPSPENLPLFLTLLDTEELVWQVLPLLTRFNVPGVATELIARLPNWEGREQAAAMEVLSSRAAWAEMVLDDIAAGNLEKKQLTAYHVRQMSNLGDEALTARLSRSTTVTALSSQVYGQCVHHSKQRR